MQPARSIFKAYDIRGVVDDTLTESVVQSIGTALGLSLPYSTSADVRAAIAQAMEGTVYASASQITFARPLAARSWLQASNPSERWKWDFMFQDLPPVKGHNVQLEGLAREGAGPNYIPLRQVDK